MGGETELVRIVREDLRFLLEHWSNKIDDDSLRRDSPILRRLLVEGLLKRAWNESGLPKQPSVIAPALSRSIGDVARNEVTFAALGGANYGGVRAMSVMMVRKVLLPTPEGVKAQEERSRPLPTLLENYVADDCMIIEGQGVKRRHLVKYVSNKLGGVHLDEGRMRKEDAIYGLLDSIHSRALGKSGATIQMAGKDVVYHCFMSMGYDLKRSPDIRRFIGLAPLEEQTL